MGNEVVRLNSLLAVTANEDLPEGFGLSEMLGHRDFRLPRLGSVIDAFAKNIWTRDSCAIEAVSAVTWLPPIQRLICIGTNCTGHASEVSSDALKTPYSLIKSAGNTLRGSGATIRLLEIDRMNDWQIELAVVIGGRAARHVEERRVLGVDRGIGKSIDGCAPMGPTFNPRRIRLKPSKPRP
jgi:hypothetical protein